MFEEFIKNAVQPLLDAEYQRGFSAGVNAEKLVKANDMAEIEHNALVRGIDMGKEIVLKDIDREIEELDAKEFAELADIEEEPFGFVGTLDDLSLVLDEEVADNE